MRHAVILAHPSPTSFDAEAARRYAATVRGFGHQTDLRDLYAMGFEPRLRASELPWSENFAVAADVAPERDIVGRADVVVFVYPLWFNAPPAMLKGYAERVFGMGFAYEPGEGGTRPLLSGKSLVSVSTSGAPERWIDQTAAVAHLRRDFDEHFAAVCGLAVLEHLNLGGVTPSIRPDAAEAMFAEVEAMARRLFAPAG